VWFPLMKPASDEEQEDKVSQSQSLRVSKDNETRES